MEPETEKIIKEQMETLPEEVRSLFTDPKINEKILEIGNNNILNTEQMEIYQTETFLLMLGLTHPSDYQDELKSKLNISDEALNNISKEIYVLFSREIIEKLKEIYEKTEDENEEKEDVIENEISKTLVFDPRFASLPQEVQEAIAKSDWKVKLYQIAPKYKLNIEQMGILEDVTIKVMLNAIHPDNYEEELTSKITIPREDISGLVKDVNEGIFEKIRNWEQNSSKQYVVSSKGGDEVPKPPYAEIIKNEELRIKNEGKDRITNYEPASTQGGLGIKNEEEKPKSIENTNFVNPKPEMPVDNSKNIMNIVEEKLKNATVSEHSVSDHSSKTPDPYREEF